MYRTSPWIAQPRCVYQGSSPRCFRTAFTPEVTSRSGNRLLMQIGLPRRLCVGLPRVRPRAMPELVRVSGKAHSSRFWAAGCVRLWLTWINRLLSDGRNPPEFGRRVWDDALLLGAGSVRLEVRDDRMFSLAMKTFRRKLMLEANSSPAKSLRAWYGAIGIVPSLVQQRVVERTDQ